MIPTPLPDYPWQKVSSDLFQLDGAQYCSCRLLLKVPRSCQTANNYLQTNHWRIFSRHGILETLV